MRSPMTVSSACAPADRTGREPSGNEDRGTLAALDIRRFGIQRRPEAVIDRKREPVGMTPTIV